MKKHENGSLRPLRRQNRARGGEMPRLRRHTEIGKEEIEKQLNLTLENLKKIGVSCFEYCEKIKEMVLPDSLKEIGETAFMYCNALESINIPHGVESITFYSFNECESLKQIIIPDSVKFIEEAAFAWYYM